MRSAVATRRQPGINMLDDLPQCCRARLQGSPRPSTSADRPGDPDGLTVRPAAARGRLPQHDAATLEAETTA
jgi:hypothetical protein